MSNEKTKRTFSAKAVAILMVLVLVLGGVMGGTMAWLIDGTDKVVNTFTYGDINIKLTETDDGDGNLLANKYEMVPGRVITNKDPQITVAGGSENAWLFVKLEELGGAGTWTFDDYLEYEIADGWALLSGNVYYREYASADTDTVIPVIKNNTVTVKTSVTKEMVNALGSGATATYPQLAITGYAVQKEGVADATTAWGYVTDETGTVIAVTPSTAQTTLSAATNDTTLELVAGTYEELTLPKGAENVTIKGGAGVEVESINLNEAKGVLIEGIVFDAADAVAVYKKDGTDTGYIANITGAESGGNNGAKNIIIRNCTFTGTPADASKYVPICFEEQGRPTSRATDITITGCKFECNAFNYVRMNYLSDGTVTITNNVFGGAGYSTGHNTMNFTGNAADLIITGNQIYNWNVEKNAIGTSRQGSNVIDVKITGNTFSNNALSVGGVIELKSSYTASNCTVDISGNTYAGGLDTFTDASAPIVKP